VEQKVQHETGRVMAATCYPINHPDGNLKIVKSLVAAAQSLGVELDTRQQAQFERFGQLIELRSKQFNLTGAKTWERIRDELFIRSLRILSPAGGSAPTPEWFAGKRAIDVGTGAGIPGIVMKIALPELQMTLLDSNAKKTTFLKEVVAELKLENVDVINDRAEELGQDPAHREAYDLVVARAVARLVELAELTLPFANIGGTVILPKSAGVDDELDEAAAAAEILGAAPAITLKFDRPGNSPPDHMVYWMKISPTPREFPRRIGVPHRSPLIEKNS
jgi:16S rRNA (guanine527-N7)-methyltransferase